jgi:poly(A) polymerase
MPALFPETAKALATNRSGALRSTLIQALRSTDARVAAEQPVTPAFLFAALLWPAYCRELAVLQKSGVEASSAQQRAADRVTLHQAERIALPRRFSLPMQEIWLLQPRFTQRVRKRVLRLLAHPRFRAAYDFLELRMHGNPEIAADVEFWREAQADPAHAAELLEAERAHEANEAEAPTRRRRRRRRGSGAGNNAGASAAHTASVQE